MKILILLVAIGIIVYVITLITGGKGDEAVENGCIASIGCGTMIFWIAAILVIFAAVIWLFS